MYSVLEKFTYSLKYKWIYDESDINLKKINKYSLNEYIPKQRIIIFILVF